MSHTIPNSEDACRRAPRISAWLAYVPMLLLFALCAAACLLPGAPARLAMRLAVILAASLLCFLGGVRRGLSFRQIGGATFGQLAMMLWLFFLGAAALLLPPGVPALLPLLAGFAALWIADPIAARRHEAPLYFAPLRRRQMALPVFGLSALVLSRLARGTA